MNSFSESFFFLTFLELQKFKLFKEHFTVLIGDFYQNVTFVIHLVSRRNIAFPPFNSIINLLSSSILNFVFSSCGWGGWFEMMMSPFIL